MRRFATLSALLALVGTLSACDATRDLPPRRAVVTAIQIDDAPLTNATGGDWDGSAGGGPEVYFRLFDDGVDYVAEPNRDLLNARDDAGFVVPTASTTPWYDDVRGTSFPLVWAIDGGFELNLTDRIYVAAFDYDPTTADDPMAATEAVTLGDVAPDFVDGREETIVLRGEGADRDLIQVRLRVVFER